MFLVYIVILYFICHTHKDANACDALFLAHVLPPPQVRVTDGGSHTSRLAGTFKMRARTIDTYYMFRKARARTIPAPIHIHDHKRRTEGFVIYLQTCKTNI